MGLGYAYPVVLVELPPVAVANEHVLTFVLHLPCLVGQITESNL